MILLCIIVLFVIILVTLPFNFEHFDYRQNLIQSAHRDICQPGYILTNCKQTTPRITNNNVLETISTICECSSNMDSNSYNIQV